MVKPVTAGRMGNFLFQAATAMGYAWDHGLEFTLPNTTNSAVHNPIYLQHLVRKDFDRTLGTVYLEETRHPWQQLPFDEKWRGKKNIFLKGWWQTEKYFVHHRNRILEEFGYPWTTAKGFVSVHVRRGDYLRLVTKHPPVTKQWYEACMERFPGFHFLFFSDDPLWCQLNFKRKDVTVSIGHTEEQDLIDMSRCEHHICSASTFSWWGAWINRNPKKRILIPKNWFQPGRPEDTSDIVPATWEKV